MIASANAFWLKSKSKMKDLATLGFFEGAHSPALGSETAQITFSDTFYRLSPHPEGHIAANYLVIHPLALPRPSDHRLGRSLASAQYQLHKKFHKAYTVDHQRRRAHDFDQAKLLITNGANNLQVIREKSVCDQSEWLPTLIVQNFPLKTVWLKRVLADWNLLETALHFIQELRHRPR